MKTCFWEILSISVTFSLFIFSMSCSSSQNESTQIDDSSNPVVNLTGEEISNLEKNRVVQFPAVLVKSPGNNCVELFTSEDFKKYKGDGKWAITSQFKDDKLLTYFSFGNKSVIVTGKMIFLKDTTDTTKTCGIITGNIFEIIKIEESK